MIVKGHFPLDCGPKYTNTSGTTNSNIERNNILIARFIAVAILESKIPEDISQVVIGRMQNERGGENNNYLRWIHLIAAVVVIIFALATSLRYLIYESQGLSVVSNAGKYVIYLTIAACAIFIVFQRSTYLPFLGETVMPCSILKEQLPEGANYEVRIPLNGPGRKVLFWAAEPDTDHLQELADWRKAYLGFHNAGVAIVSEDNTVVLRVRKPHPYSVPQKGRLEAHIHYRVCGAEGMLGPVQTHFLEEPVITQTTENTDAKEVFNPVPDVDEKFFASAVY